MNPFRKIPKAALLAVVLAAVIIIGVVVSIVLFAMSYFRDLHSVISN